MGFIPSLTVNELFSGTANQSSNPAPHTPKDKSMEDAENPANEAPEGEGEAEDFHACLVRAETGLL